MRISLFAGDLCDVEADALCTSTNPRLSLAMGTGGSVRSRGGFQILRECEGIVAAVAGGEKPQRARGLPPGSAHQTTAGDLPAKLIIHCVASDAAHRSTAGIIASCVKNALALAAAAGCASIAMPVFGTGHARFRFEDALRAMMTALRAEITSMQHAIIVIYDDDRLDDALQVINSVVPDIQVDVQRGSAHDEIASMWPAGW